MELIAKLLGEAHAGLDRLEQQLAPVLVSAAPTCAGDKMQAGHPETARCPMVEDLDSIADAILSFVAREQGLIARLEL